MAEKRTYVKRITVGRPVKSINEAASGVVIGSGRQYGDILVNKPSTNLFEPGSLVAGHGLDKSFGDSNSNNIVMSIDSSELKDIIDSDYIKFMTGQATTRNFVDSAYVEANSLDSERTLLLLDSEYSALPKSLIPYYDSALDLGSPTHKWRTLYLSGKTIELGALTISDETQTFVVKDSDGNVAAFNLSGNTTSDIAEGTNLYYTRARFDSALGDTISDSNIRGKFSIVDAGGDGSFAYDSASGKFTYTGPSSAEVRAHFSAVDSGGDGAFRYEEATGKFIYTGPSATEVRSHFNTAIAGGDGFLAYDSALGKFTYTGPSADSIRSHFSAAGDLTYNSSTGEFSFDVETVYTQANFESDLSLSLNATNGIAYDSASHKLSLINTGVDSGTYGSSTRVPILRIQSDGRVDSAGSVLVAGVTGVSFDSATETITISTADGNSFSTAIGGYDNLQATTFTGTNATIDSAVISFISGGHANYDSAHISQLLVDSGRFTVLTSPDITADSAIITDISGSSINYTTAHLANITADSAALGNVTITGDLTVSGTQTTINTQTVKVHDPIIHLADSNEQSDIVDLGFVGKYYRDGQQRHTGLVRDASNEQYYLFRNVVDSAMDSSATINRSATGFATADLNVANLIADSATMTNLTVTGLASTTLARAATVDSGTYGSSTLIPQITVNTSGFIDSIGEVLVAGVTGLTYDSATAKLTISTADGGSFPVVVDGFGDDKALEFGDSGNAKIKHTSGGTTIFETGAMEFDIDGAKQLLIKNNAGGAKIAEFHTFGAVDLYHGSVKRFNTDSYGSTIIGRLAVDSATATNLTATTITLGGQVVNNAMFTDSAFVLSMIESRSLDSERTINMIRGDRLFVDSAYVELRSLDSERTINLIDSDYINERSHQLTRDEFSFTLTNAGSAAGPRILLDRNSSSAADSDALAMIEFRGRNDADSNITYAKIENFINDASADSEDGELHFTVKQSGVLRTKMKMTPTGIVLAGNERIMFSDDSFHQALIPGNYTADHGLTLPDSTGTILTREFVSNLIDSAYIGARQASTGLTLDFDDSAGTTLVQLVITQAATIQTGSVIGFGNTVTLLDKDSAAVTISL